MADDPVVRAFYADCSRPREYVGTVGRNGKHACPCCRHFTLDGRGNYDICGVCFWEDDGQDDHDADEHHAFSPNKGLSLSEARRNFASFGACDRASIPHVEPPSLDELPEARQAAETEASDE